MNKTCNLNGVRIAYDSYGTGNHALVFIHGWCCHADFWTEQKPLFERYRSIVVEVPGHGRSDAPLDYDYSIEHFANAIHAVLKQENITKVVLCGHSMGVVISTMFLRLYPDMVSGVFYNDGPFQPPHSEQSKAQREASSFLQEDDEKFRGIFASMLGSLDEKKGEWILDQMLSAPKYMRVNSVTSATIPHSFGYNEVFDIPAVRHYAIFGPADPRWKHHVPQLQDIPWEGSGHFLQMEHPDKFNKAVIEFIDGHHLL